MRLGRRIIPISSGKGGVGKTTFAINFALALSRHGRTLLVDVDTGTSSVRNSIDTPVQRDLYHFFNRGYRLEDCITTLSKHLDPGGRFGDFGFVAAPKHFIEELTRFEHPLREKLIDAINTLDVRFVVLDLKAGLDMGVIEFLPYSNSGLLVFTPFLRPATLAAGDIVKAILFRRLRATFGAGSPVYRDLKGITPSSLNALIDRVEDAYGSGVHNLDAFIAVLQSTLGDQPIVKFVASAIDTFMVYFVLNMFNGVKESYDTAVKPFVDSLSRNVSTHLTVLNLGWVMAHDEINQGNIRRVPVLLRSPARTPRRAEGDGLARELEKLARRYVGARPGSSRKRNPAAAYSGSEPSRSLNVQLDTLRRMYEDMKDTSYGDNFKYIVYRCLHIMSSRRASDFGDTRIFKSSEIQQAVARRGR